MLPFGAIQGSVGAGERAVGRGIGGIEANRLEQILQGPPGLTARGQDLSSHSKDRGIGRSESDRPFEVGEGAGCIARRQGRLPRLAKQGGVLGVHLEGILEVFQGRVGAALLEELQGAQAMVGGVGAPPRGLTLLPLQPARVPQSSLRELIPAGVGVRPGELETGGDVGGIESDGALEDLYRPRRVASVALHHSQDSQGLRVTGRPLGPPTGIGGRAVQIALPETDPRPKRTGLREVGGARQDPVELFAGVVVPGLQESDAGETRGGGEVIGAHPHDLPVCPLRLSVAPRAKRRLSHQEGSVGIIGGDVLLQQLQGLARLTLPQQRHGAGTRVARRFAASVRRRLLAGGAAAGGLARQQGETGSYQEKGCEEMQRETQHSRIIAHQRGLTNRLSLVTSGGDVRMSSVSVKTRLLGLLGAFLVLPGAAPSEEDTPSRIVSRLEAYYRATPGITADFVQIVESRTLRRPREESGRVYLKPPGRMRWEYERPRGKLAVTDGRRTYIYLPEDRQVIVGRVQDLDEGAVAARLLLGTSPIEKDFLVEGHPAPALGGLWLLKLTAKGADFPYDSVTLEVEEASGAIRRIQLLDPLGNRIEYRFDHIRVSRNLPDRIFAYSVPKGVDVQVVGERDGTLPASP